MHVVHEQCKLVRETVELAKTLVDSLAPQKSVAFATDAIGKKYRPNLRQNRSKRNKPNKPTSVSKGEKDLEDDNLGDHAHPDATDPP